MGSKLTTANNAHSKHASGAIQNKDDLYAYIIDHWFRTTMKSVAVAYPLEIIGIIQAMVGHQRLDGFYKMSSSRQWRPNVTIALRINEDNHSFALSFSYYYDPAEGLEMMSEGHYAADANLTGDDILFDYSNDCFVLQLTDTSKQQLVNSFNCLLDHSLRKKEYIERTKQLIARHKSGFKALTWLAMYEKATMSKDWSRPDLYHDQITIFSQDTITNANSKDETKFVDLHDIYRRVCAEFDEVPLPIFVGGDVFVRQIDRYHLSLHFKTATGKEEKWMLGNTDVFKIWMCTVHDPMNRYHRDPVSTEIILQIDEGMKYYQLLYMHSCTYYNTRCKFKSDGKIINKCLGMSTECNYALQSLLKGTMRPSPNHTIPYSLKFEILDDGKMKIYCSNNGTIWVLPPCPSPRVYDFERYQVTTM